MTRDELLAHCLGKPGAWLDQPWENDVVVKVGGRIFAFLGADSPTPSVGVKCAANREMADEWLLRYPADASVMPYIGRSGWNTLRANGEIPDDELLEAVDACWRMSTRTSSTLSLSPTIMERRGSDRSTWAVGRSSARA